MLLSRLTVTVEIREYKSYSELYMEMAEPRVGYLSQTMKIQGLEVDDVAQELRLKLWKSLPKYCPEKAAFSTWSETVLRNHLKNLHNHSKVDLIDRCEIRTPILVDCI